MTDDAVEQDTQIDYEIDNRFIIGGRLKINTADSQHQLPSS